MLLSREKDEFCVIVVFFPRENQRQSKNLVMRPQSTLMRRIARQLQRLATPLLPFSNRGPLGRGKLNSSGRAHLLRRK